MQNPLHIPTTVLPGGRIEILDQKLPVGESVKVVILGSSTAEQRSAVDILSEAPGQRLFKTAEEVAHYLKDEMSSWDR